MWLDKLSVTWLVLFKCYVFNSFCVFIFVVFCVTSFLMVMYGSQMDELRKGILPKDIPRRMWSKPQLPQSEVKNADRVVGDSETKTPNCNDCYESLVVDLKKDIRKTKEEVRALQNQVSSLSVQRESLKHDVLKQQEDYRKILGNFTKELETRKTLCRPWQ